MAAPIVKDFFKIALADKPAVPFRVPAGIKLIRIDARSGMRAGPGTERAILEAFKPGTAPPDSYSVVGYGENPDGQPMSDVGQQQQQQQQPRGGGFFNFPIFRSGTGGLY